ncbi:clathrin adaptor, mu subunit, partial [Ceratobasidium sp. AG-I]
SPQPSTIKPAFKASGMKLGKKAKQSDLLDALGGEIATPDSSIPGTPLPTDLSSSATLPAQPTQTYPAVHEESVHVLIRERIKATILRDGRPKELEITGDLDLKVSDPADARVRLVMAPIGAGGEGAQFKQHPNVAKFVATAGVSGEVKLKDPARAFPIGQPLGVLKWRWGSKDESGIPLSINCWPSPAGDGTCEVNIEWELENKELELQDVVISIPLPSGAYPTVSSHTGSWAINPNTHSLDWTTETVSADAETTGSLEFSVGGDDAEAFFPVKVNFKSEKSLIGVEVLSAERVGGEGSVVFSKEMRVGVEQYLIV